MCVLSLNIAVSLPRKSVVRLTDRPDMTLDVYCGRNSCRMSARGAWISQCVNEVYHEPEAADA